MIEISRQLSIDKIEQLYESLKPKNHELIDIKLPLKIEGSEFGLVPALIQFVASWIRSGSAGKVLVSATSVEQIEQFINEDFAYPIIILSWQQGIERSDSRQDIRTEIRKFNREINYRMRSLKDIRGNQLLLTCFDHVPTEVGLLGCFYDNTSFIPSEDILDFTLLPILTQILGFNRESFRKSVTPILNDLKGIIYELMKNTHEWARSDRHNKPINPNIRGLYARFVKKNKDSLKEGYLNHGGLRNFFDDLKVNDQNQLYFIEICVFDSGAGFIDKYPELSASDTKLSKPDIIKKCLIRRNTAAKGIDATGKGMGLDRILRILDNKGFLLIRTDEVFLYRNLRQCRYKETQSLDEVDLFDWTTNSANEANKHANAAGSTLSIIYPL